MNEYRVEYSPAIEAHIVATLWRDLHQRSCGGVTPLSEKEKTLYDTLTLHLTHLAALVEIRHS